MINEYYQKHKENFRKNARERKDKRPRKVRDGHTNPPK